MALSEDSRTLLQLLLGRGKSYRDISGLLGIDESEVRDRAHQALTEINGGDPDRDLNLTDYLLGQSDPISRAEVARELAGNQQAAETASSLTDQLRLLVPGADLPKVPGGKVTPAKRGLTSRPGPSKAGSPKAENETGQGRSLTGKQRRNIALLLGAALIAVVVILALTGTFDGGDESSGTDGDPAPTTASLNAVRGESGEGDVQFGFSGADLAANLDFTGLKPTSDGRSYVLWLNGSAGAFPIHQSEVEDDGAIGGQIRINQAVICFIAADIFPTMRLSRVDDSQMETVLRQAARANRGQGAFPEYAGETVLQGGIAMPQESKEQILPSCAPAGTSASGQ